MQQRRPAVDPGALRDLIEFQLTPDPDTKDGFGATQEAYATDFKVYAQYQALNSTEFPEKWKLVAQTTARFLIRYRADINVALHQIIFDGRTYDITGFREVDNRRTHAYVEVQVID